MAINFKGTYFTVGNFTCYEFYNHDGELERLDIEKDSLTSDTFETNHYDYYIHEETTHTHDMTELLTILVQQMTAQPFDNIQEDYNEIMTKANGGQSPIVNAPTQITQSIGGITMKQLQGKLNSIQAGALGDVIQIATAVQQSNYTMSQAIDLLHTFVNLKGMVTPSAKQYMFLKTYLQEAGIPHQTKDETGEIIVGNRLENLPFLVLTTSHTDEQGLLYYGAESGQETPLTPEFHLSWQAELYINKYNVALLNYNIEQHVTFDPFEIEYTIEGNSFGYRTFEDVLDALSK